MKLNALQHKVLQRLRSGSDGVVLVSILEDVVKELSDVRNIKEVNEVEVKGRQLACTILEEQVISRLKMSSGSDELLEDSFE